MQTDVSPKHHRHWSALPDERAIQVTQLVAENIPAFWGLLALEVRVKDEVISAGTSLVDGSLPHATRVFVCLTSGRGSWRGPRNRRDVPVQSGERCLACQTKTIRHKELNHFQERMVVPRGKTISENTAVSCYHGRLKVLQWAVTVSKES